ncbi:MAG: transcriptional regulator [Thermoplasmata archaeon]
MLIKEEKLKKALLKALADEYSSKILSSTAWKAVSVMDLVRDEGIPSTSAYRRIGELKDQGLLVVDRTIVTKDGKKYDLYKGTFREVTVTFRRGSVEVSAIPNRDVFEKAFLLFHSLREKSK